MRTACLIISYLVLMGSFACRQAGSSGRQPSGGTAEGSATALALSMDSLRSFTSDTTLLIEYDPFLGRMVSVTGFSLNRALRAAGWLADPGYELAFYCLDGYKSTLPVAELAQYDGYVTFQAGNEARWPDRLRDRVGDFYLTWNTAGEHYLPRPYGLEEVRLYARSDLDDERLNPPALAGDANFQRGLALFGVKCKPCHSVNGVGGSFGPELNIPRNITEYRDKEFIRDFVRAPESFRYGSKMSGIRLSEGEFEQLLNYLRVMGTYKVEVK